MEHESEVKLSKLASCAGCGAKVGAGTLSTLLGDMPVRFDENLLVGYDKSDDAAVYRVSDELCIVETVDFFPPMVDDPFTFGQIAAANALSDIYAMGAEPKLALNLLCVPKSMPKDAVQAILRGGYDKVYEAGAVIAGGHSIYSDEPKYGLCVTGYARPDRVLKNFGAQSGDVLLLTKPLGTGVLMSAFKGEVLSKEAYSKAVRSMTTLNAKARDAMVKYRVHACTDVTGFSLLGHLLEMMQGSDTEARLDTENIGFFPEALELAEMGILPEGMYRNRDFAEEQVDCQEVPLAVCDLLFDPQTSGGLLIAVAPEDAETLFSELQGQVPLAQRIGEVLPYSGQKRIYLC
ncbi:MAG: selenide, water dikinase SelD [Clostridia bacterium]|nr:selenide, water dikinase SelD [Clostridia bacterium]